MIGFTEHFFTIALNYSAIANRHNSLQHAPFSSLYPYLLLASTIATRSRSQSYITTDGQSASLSWNKAPIWGLGPDLYYCQTVAGLFMWGALSDERTSLSFKIAAGPRQRSHSRARVPCDSRPYFTFSDSRLHCSSPPTTRRTTVEVFEPSSVRVRVRVTLRLTVSQSVCLGVEPRLGLMTRYELLFDSYCLVLGRAPSLTRGRVCRLSVSQQY
jgi:hypothetical protein